MGSGCESSLSGLQPHRGHQHRSNPILCNVRTGSYTWNWIFPVPKADREMGLSDWIEVVQERFQRDTTSHSTAEFSILQTDHVKVGSWRVGLDHIGLDRKRLSGNISSSSGSNGSVRERKTQNGQHRCIKRIQSETELFQDRYMFEKPLWSRTFTTFVKVYNV